MKGTDHADQSFRRDLLNQRSSTSYTSKVSSRTCLPSTFDRPFLRMILFPLMTTFTTHLVRVLKQLLKWNNFTVYVPETMLVNDTASFPAGLSPHAATRLSFVRPPSEPGGPSTERSKSSEESHATSTTIGRAVVRKEMQSLESDVAMVRNTDPSSFTML